MRAVAERAVTAVLASAEVNRAILLSLVRSRRKACSLVGSIAEGLRGTLATGAPVIGLSCFDIDRDGRFLSDGRFGHERAD
jgi:hypothetical protein